MKRPLTLALLAFVALASAPSEAAQPAATPNNVRASVLAFVGDSITFELRWAPAPRGRLQAPIEGYEAQMMAEAPDGSGRIAATATTDADGRTALLTVYHDCEDPRNQYTARVRALGAFSGLAPWGEATTIVILCDNSPPGPPTVEADTLPVDTVSGGISGIETESTPLASWARVTDTGDVETDALGQAFEFCAYTRRDDGIRRRAGWAVMEPPRAESADGTEVEFTALDGEQACWSVAVTAAGG